MIITSQARAVLARMAAAAAANRYEGLDRVSPGWEGELRANADQEIGTDAFVSAGRLYVTEGDTIYLVSQKRVIDFPELQGLSGYRSKPRGDRHFVSGASNARIAGAGMPHTPASVAMQLDSRVRPSETLPDPAMAAEDAIKVAALHLFRDLYGDQTDHRLFRSTDIYRAMTDLVSRLGATVAVDSNDSRSEDQEIKGAAVRLQAELFGASGLGFRDTPRAVVIYDAMVDLVEDLRRSGVTVGATSYSTDHVG